MTLPNEVMNKGRQGLQYCKYHKCADDFKYIFKPRLIYVPQHIIHFNILQLDINYAIDWTNNNVLS